ncbi:iron uptake transporter permease EfeU [Nakamurella deserti]|uniref:iron uptake transporter permease EfeU n=1 Tax=Nakamurella deserti TaxID=2164074 RepID=UPI000DBE13B8|nr:iron uptake transporter permease EfeU [Nakamurella deserti]
MLTTFVIGLREGLEASLIVGIVAAFLRRNAGADASRALRRMWVGVGAAVAICLAGGIALSAVNAHLPQRQQEMLECIVAVVAVVMVTYMILWMNSHSRGLKGELETAAAGALARGSSWALVSMAFLAVLREGFETSVFLLAAFGAAVSPVAAAGGVVLGLAVAVVLGYLVYRGGTRLDLSRFFRVTGVVLVLVAGGLVMSALQAAHEAAWLTVGQQPVADLGRLVRPGSIQASLLGGVLGVQPQPVVVQVVAWLLYVVPMLAIVLWPRTRRLRRPAAAKLVLGAGAGLAAVAVLLVALVPAGPVGTSAVDLDVVGVGAGRGADADRSYSGVTAVTVRQLTGASLQATVTATADAGSDASFAVGGDVTMTLAGAAVVDGVTVNRYEAAAPSTGGAGGALPVTVSGADITALTGGRLPIGLTGADSSADLPATWLDSWRVTVSVDPASGVVLDAQTRLVRSLQVVNSTGVSVSVGVVADVTTAATPAVAAGRLAAAAAGDAARQRAEVWGQVVPALLGVAALVLFAAGLRLALRRPAAPAAPPPVRRPEPAGTR